MKLVYENGELAFAEDISGETVDDKLAELADELINRLSVDLEKDDVYVVRAVAECRTNPEIPGVTFVNFNFAVIPRSTLQ